MGVAANVESRGMRWPLTRWDVAGAFGDIGVLFPIAIALISLNHVNPTAVFLAAGVTYVLAGRYFQIPMAVQPFKAVAAIALAMGLSPSSIASAGLLMGALIGLVGVTNLATRLATDVEPALHGGFRGRPNGRPLGNRARWSPSFAGLSRLASPSGGLGPADGRDHAWSHGAMGQAARAWLGTTAAHSPTPTSCRTSKRFAIAGSSAICVDLW